MTIMENPARVRAAATYDAAADHFDEAPLAFWDRHGQRTVDRLQLRPGVQVLDVGCGTGASVLPAAAAVGPNGSVIGIDVAENMLTRARAKAKARRLENVAFTLADMSDSGLPDETFDAVVSVFSVFFVPDIERQISELWRMVRPGGQLAVTVWGPGAFEPCAPIFGEELRRFRPDITISGRPWERLTDSRNLRQLLLDGGTSEPTVNAFSDSQPLSHPKEWWTIALGSGFRWEINQLTPDQQKAVRRRTTERLARMGTSALGTNALCAIARKPASVSLMASGAELSL